MHPGLLEMRDSHGMSITDALAQYGFDPSPAALEKIRVPRSKVCACLFLYSFAHSNIHFS